MSRVDKRVRTHPVGTWAVLEDSRLRLRNGGPSMVAGRRLAAEVTRLKELRDAGAEFQAASAARDADDYGARKVYDRYESARIRFDAALAAVSP